ncbi:MAG: hypothetical protein N4S07_06320, partial [Lactobacillus iners]|nr:hypothetical protein [Lactobacillus iners]
GLNLGKVALYQLSYVRNATLLSNVSAEARVTTIPEIFSNASPRLFGVSFGGVCACWLEVCYAYGIGVFASASVTFSVG